MLPNRREEAWGYVPPKRLKRARRAKGVKKLYAKGEQVSLAHKKTWGGPRAGAGRKAGPRPSVFHRARPKLLREVPVHVTMRRAKGLPSFRSERIHNLLRDAVRDTHRRLSGFRIVEYSIQADHLHLIVEADDRALLSTGVRSFSVRVAMRINKQIFGRTRGKGKVWGDRYHRRDLPTPPEVRNALVYVLNNAVKHGELRAGSIDPYSSAPWFSGWIDGRGPPEGAPDSVAEQAQCWLLTDGWPKVFPGFLHVQETPKARAHR